jgi:hypothetical protein
MLGMRHSRPAPLTCPRDRVGLCAGSQDPQVGNRGGFLDRVTPPSQRNLRTPQRVVPGMRPINDAHVAVPGLAVVEVPAADDETAFAVQELLAARRAIAPTDRTIREPDVSRSPLPPAQHDRTLRQPLQGACAVSQRDTRRPPPRVKWRSPSYRSCSGQDLCEDGP